MTMPTAPAIMIPIPERMRHLERDRRGYPIFSVVYRDDTGRPHFTINDEVKRQRHILNDLCQICGTKLFRGRWFVGGPLAAFDERGVYIDTGMHAECMRYALQACPYLAAPNYSDNKRIDDATLPHDDPNTFLIDPTMIPERPQVFVAVMSIGQRLHWEALPNGRRWVRYVAAVRPFRRVEFWRHGVQLGEAEGREFAALSKMPADTELKPPRFIVRPRAAIHQESTKT